MSSGEVEAERASKPASRWTLVRAIALLITAVSVLAAVAAWRASVVTGNASSLDQQASQERVRLQQIEGQIDAQVDQDLRLFPRYLSHLANSEVLTAKGNQERKDEPELADRLLMNGDEELALARTFYQAMTVKPLFGQTNYLEDHARTELRSRNLDLLNLDPAQTLSEAQDERRRGVRLVGVTALLVLSLFFLTVAQVVRRRLRQGFAALGVLLMLGASLALVVVG